KQQRRGGAAVRTLKTVAVACVVGTLVAGLTLLTVFRPPSISHHTSLNSHPKSRIPRAGNARSPAQRPRVIVIRHRRTGEALHVLRDAETLRGADLRRAQLAGADLRCADLRGA